MPAKKKVTQKKVVAKKIDKKIIVRGKPNPKFDIYKKLLLKIKEQINGDIRNLNNDNSGSANDGGGDVSGHALHMADVATDMYDREFAMGLAANDRELLARIAQALGRIQNGTFGNCVDCKKPIASTRLKAIPHAETCLKCQEKLESRRG